MSHQFQLDAFDRYREQGLAAWRQGKADKARQYLLKAAEMLLGLAAQSQGQLREARKASARQLIDLARSIQAGAKPVQVAGAVSAGDEDAEDAAGDAWVVTRSPDVRLEDVAGLDDVKALIRRRVIYPFQHPEITSKYRKQVGGGVLLYGPPGTGKTMMAKAIASEVDGTFFSVRCSDIMSKWVGQAEKNLRRLFDSARRHPRAVVFLDETEAIVAKRGGDSTVMNRVIPEFLSQVDGLQGRHSGLLLLGATNRPWDMDEAALRPGRFGERVYVPLPDPLARKQILASALHGIPLAPEVDIDDLTTRTQGYSGADLVALCETAKDHPYEREIVTGIPQRLEAQDVQDALRQLRPSVSANQLARYEKFRQG